MSGNAKETKENKSFQDKIKQYFRTNRGNQGHRSRPDFTLTEDIERVLSSESSTATRVRAIKELCDVVVSNKLKDKVVEKLWACLQDLFSKDQPEELRHLAFHFLQCLLKGQNERLSLMRAHFFRVVKIHDHPDDIVQRFELFQALTNYGKDACYFEEEVAPFLLKILPEITNADLTLGYLSVITTFIKFNAAYMENSISQLVLQISMLCLSTSKTEVVMACIEVLDTILAYSNLPSEILPHFIAILCRTVNGEVYCQLSWQVMRNLLGTHMGHASLYTMCQMLEEPSLKQDSGLLRGAVFFINMGLWCTHPILNLKCPPSSVLPSIQQAVESNQPIVTYEVMLSMQGLVANLGLQLHDPEWDIIITILSIIIRQIEAAPDVAPNVLVATHLHETLNTIENYIEVGSFHGSIEQFYGLIGECSLSRPESSVSKLISYLAQDIIPIRHSWFSNLYNLLQKYYQQETRTNVRLKTLSVLSKVINLNRYEYEDELIDRIVVPHLIHSSGDHDPIIRTAVAELLLDLSIDCESKKCLELLDILEKLLLRPFEQYLGDVSANEMDISDMKNLVMGLINVFVHKIYRLPSIHAVRIYMMLVTFLEHHYLKPKIFEDYYHLRYKILECFLKMRADSLYHVGCADSAGKLRFSPYLCITYHETERGPMGSPPPMSPAISLPAPCIITSVPLRPAFKIIILCLTQEKDWEVLQMVLQDIPLAMQNKSLILSRQGNKELDLLVNALCRMITDKYLCLPDSLRNAVKLSKADFHIAVLLALASLASYHSYLDHAHQYKMIRCLVKYGLVPRCSRQCIAALSICTLEMKEVMVKMLPEVLLDLSKISATVHIAIPVLEFLSTLTKLPDVFANFVGDQYMAVFAISLPFTNPFKYNHYIVSLAHHVIAVWFLKCRMPFRREFITYISKGLQTNVLVPFEETNPPLRSDLSKLNEDSSNRKRSSSLTEQSSRRRERASTIARADGKVALDFRQVTDRTLQTFYEELTETCQDLMARYTFSSYSALPRRSPTTDYILSGGHSTTWFLGNKLITITTSGCTQKALRNGLCDKCLTMCRLDRLKSPDIDRNVLLIGRSNSSDKDKDDSNSSRVTRQNSGEKSNNNTSTSSPLEENKELTDKLEQLPSKMQQLMSIDGKLSSKQACVCWCQGWAEIYVRRATGDMSWIMRIQNQISQQLNMSDYPLNEILTLFTPSVQQCAEEMESTDNQCHSESVDTGNHDEEFSSTASMPISIPGSPCKQSPSRQSSRDSIDEDMENIYEDGSKSRNPVRRSNSSPEMSASWKNPFLQKQERDREESKVQDEENTKKMKTYTKDMRVSCEAIPEEISGMGTTPPSIEPVSTSKDTQHPALLSCHSYPGSTPPQEQTVVSKVAHTVPPSPNVIHTTSPLTLPTMQSQASRLLTMHSSSSKSSKSESSDSVNSEKGIERPTSLTSLPNLPPLSSKPPQSPTQTSPRLPRHIQTKDGHEIQKSSSLNLERTHSLKNKEKKSGSNEKLNQLDLSQAQKRDRGYTISVMSTIRKPRLENLRHTISSRPKEIPKSGNIPSFVFLQLYHSAEFGSTTEKPLLVTSSQVVQRAVKVLDCIPPYETHRIGVIYVREGQCNNETEILRNPYGSVRYVHFLQNLGTLIKLQDVDPQVIYLGGLNQDGNDGKFTYIWQEDVIRVTFHVATLMPNKESDPNCTNKKLHIGNNNVTIVYNESGEDYNINTIRGQFNFACIIVQPLDHSTNKVTIKAKEELIELMGTSEPKIVSDKNVAILARQLALHADLASLVSRSIKCQSSDPYASNWLERLRKIKNVRTKILQEAPKRETGPDDGVTRQPRRMDDFSEYA